LNTVRKAAASLRAKHPGDEITLKSLYRRWDRTARIDVIRVDSSIPALQGRIGDPLEILFMVQDSSAGSILLGVGADPSRGRQLFEDTLYGAGYVARPVADVLIIGLGGGPDVQTALYHGAQAIVGVDINASILDMVGSRFADFVGNPYARPQVRTHHMDGRTYLRSTDETFDLIQLSGVDTKALLPSGSLSVNENYIYTREAMTELLRRLKPEGILSIIRFGEDVHRVASIAIVGLRDRGTREPERHIVALAQGLWRCVLVKREPFTAAELDRIHGWVEGRAGTAPHIVIPAYDWIGVGLSHPLKMLYSPPPRAVTATDFFEALAADRYDAFVATADRDLSAPDDNRPYFFLSERPAEALRSPPWYLTTLYWNILQLGVVAAIFIFTPLIVMRRRGLGASGSSRALVHFLCLGAAFMFVEIGLIQRFVLLLGHQSYAVTVVLFGLLLGASLGSVVSGWMSLGSRRPLTLALSGLVLAVLFCALGLGPLLEAAAGLHFGPRLALALAILVILGVPMGMPFPLALAALRASNAPLVAWGIGVNGFASVIASTTAVPMALLAGLRALIVAGAILYALALLTSPVGRDGAPTSA
jgi:SAM-dependent methyltransferase